ncbi:MAG: response regulator, partial [Verrucomicrobiota bacterium]
MNAADWKLIALALVAIGTLVLLITRYKVNAFIALLLASLLVGGGAVALGRVAKDAAGKDVPYTVLSIARSFSDGLGATLGGIAAVIAFGTMLGRLLAESGGAEVLAKRFAAFFGAGRIQWCIMALALAIGLTTWFAVGLVLLLPILLTLTHETKQPFLRLALPLLACLSVMHGVMPPHPGPVVAVEALKANMGLVLFWGFVIGIPTAAVAGPIYAKIISGRVVADPPPIPPKTKTAAAGFRPPGFWLTLFSIMLPVALMLVATVAELILPKGIPAREVLTFLGNPTIALLLAAIAFPLAMQALDQAYYISFASRIMIYALAATSLNLILGYGGMISFGHAAFVGAGTYVAGIMIVEGMPGALIGWPLAMLLPGLLALAIGAVSLRTRGVYFIMITLAFAQMMYYLFISLKAYGGEDGLSLTRRLREARSNIPIVMLTAMGEDTDRIVGLEMGADDYVPRPFNPRELLARIKPVLLVDEAQEMASAVLAELRLLSSTR